MRTSVYYDKNFDKLCVKNKVSDVFAFKSVWYDGHYIRYAYKDESRYVFIGYV